MHCYICNAKNHYVAPTLFAFLSFVKQKTLRKIKKAKRSNVVHS